MSQRINKPPKLIEVVSFGYKHGDPPAASLVVDARFVDNPHWDEALRPLTGADKPVQDYILAQGDVADYLGDLKKQVRRQLRGYITHGSDHERVVFAFGCTGGKHRSRFFAIRVADYVREILGEFSYQAEVRLTHRDEGKE